VLAQSKQMTGAKENFGRAIALGDNSPEAKATWQKSLRRLPPERNLFPQAAITPGTQIFGESIQATHLNYS
jgi:hypothetical protein